MTGYRRLQAIAVPFGVDTVDTDQIFPARFMSRDRSDGGYGDFFFHDLRFGASGVPRTGFVLNDPRLTGAAILVAAANYGVGSGRPGAVLSHLDYGIRIVIAQSFGPVFSAVAYKSGLLTIELAHDEVTALRAELEAHPGSSLTVDLDEERVASTRGIAAHFQIDPFVKRIIMEGKSEIELTLTKAEDIALLEQRQRADRPWLFAPRAEE